MADTKKIGTCKACGKDIWRGGRSGAYMGHKITCKNVRTKKLES